MNLSAIVFCCASVPACIAYYLSRSSAKQAVWPRGAIMYSLGYSAAVGYLMALAATDLVKGIVSSSGLLGKRSSGSIHPLSWLLFAPYHLGLRIKLLAGRRLISEPLYTRVLPGWYIGGWPWSSRELPPAESPASTVSVLDCTCELPRTHRNRYLCLPIWDTQAPPLTLVDRGVAFARSERQQGKSVYVHCAHGHGRSALLLIACLLDSGEVATAQEGLALLQALRPRVRLNGRQQRTLDEWARGRGLGGLQMRPLGAAGAAAAASGAGANGGERNGGLSGGVGVVQLSKGGPGAVHLVADAHGGAGDGGLGAGAGAGAAAAVVGSGQGQAAKAFR